MSAGSRYASNLRSKRRSRAKAAEGTAAVLEERLTELAEAAGDLTPVWPEAGKVWAQREERIFATQSSGRWQPLSTPTLIRKRKEGLSTEPLVETGVLMRSLTSELPRSAGLHFAVYGPAKGESIDYAKFHMRGMGVPQRHPVPRFNPGEREAMIEKIRAHLGMGR